MHSDFQAFHIRWIFRKDHNIPEQHERHIPGGWAWSAWPENPYCTCFEINRNLHFKRRFFKYSKVQRIGEIWNLYWQIWSHLNDYLNRKSQICISNWGWLSILWFRNVLFLPLFTLISHLEPNFLKVFNIFRFFIVPDLSLPLLVFLRRGLFHDRGALWKRPGSCTHESFVMQDWTRQDLTRGHPALIWVSYPLLIWVILCACRYLNYM